MSDEFLTAAKAKEAQLRKQLEADPVYQQWTSIQKFIAEYAAITPPVLKPVAPLSGNLTKIAKYGRQGSVTATCIEASESFLRHLGKRAMTTVILTELLRQGIVPNSLSASTLASYLSTSALFDNVRGEGYGLVEWSQPNSLNDEAPDSGQLSSAPKNNGQLPLNS